MAGTRLLTVAWTSIVLGLAVQLVLVLFAAGYGRQTALAPFVSELVGKVSWSFVVCSAIAAGTAAAAAVRPLVMGTLGLLTAPLAFHIARILQNSTADALSAVSSGASAPPPFQLAVIRGVEYGLFGALIGWIGRRPWGGLEAHILAGLAVGAVFAGVVCWLMVRGAAEPPSGYALAARAINEMLFPAGCAIVLRVAGVLGRRTLR